MDHRKSSGFLKVLPRCATLHSSADQLSFPPVPGCVFCHLFALTLLVPSPFWVVQKLLLLEKEIRDITHQIYTYSHIGSDDIVTQ